MKLEEGLIIRVSTDLSSTEALWGTNDEMREMKGTIRAIQQVQKNVSSKRAGLHTCIMLSDDFGTQWSFSVDDIRPAEDEEPPKPITVMFDPKYLEGV